MRKSAMKIVSVFALCFALAGCFGSTTKPPVETAPVIVHQARPAPIQRYDFRWHVVPTEDKGVIVGLEYNDSLEFRLFLEDVYRYNRDTNELLCFYRKDLNEDMCKKSVDTSE
jgi:hypothetical protein